MSVFPTTKIDFLRVEIDRHPGCSYQQEQFNDALAPSQPRIFMDNKIHDRGYSCDGGPSNRRLDLSGSPASEQLESRTLFLDFKPCSPKDEQGFSFSPKTPIP